MKGFPPMKVSSRQSCKQALPGDYNVIAWLKISQSAFRIPFLDADIQTSETRVQALLPLSTPVPPGAPGELARWLKKCIRIISLSLGRLYVSGAFCSKYQEKRETDRSPETVTQGETENKRRWRHFITMTKILFVIPFTSKFGNPKA